MEYRILLWHNGEITVEEAQSLPEKMEIRVQVPKPDVFGHGDFFHAYGANGYHRGYTREFFELDMKHELTDVTNGEFAYVHKASEDALGTYCDFKNPRGIRR